MIKINFPQKRRNVTWPTTRGFSLVELMIAVIILGALAAVSAPSILRSIERNNARDEARAIANVFQRARSLATSHGQPVLATIGTTAAGSTESATITLYRPNDTNITSCSAAHGVARQTVLTYTIGSRYPGVITNNNAGTAELCFSPSGRLVNSGSNRPFVATQPAGCEERNLMIWLHKENTTASADHTKCVKTGPTDIGAQKDAREMINFFMIHVPYAGNAEVLQ